MSPIGTARTYLALQAAAGAAWWVAVFASSDVRQWTLGGWDPGLLAGPDLLLFVGASALAAALSSPRIATIAAIWTTVVTASLLVYGIAERRAGWGVVAMSLATVGTAAAAATLRWRRLPLGWFFVGPFAFREAKERAPGQHLRRSLRQLLFFWTVFFVLVPLVLTWLEKRLRLDWAALDSRMWDRVSIGILAPVSALGLWACVAMATHGEGTPLPSATARKLAVAGPYRWVRNPMAVAGGLQTASVGLWLGSWMVIAIAGGGALAWNTFIRPSEEADLRARFGAEYEEYRSSVRCWVPTFGSR